MVEQFEIRSGPHRIRGLFTTPDRAERFPCVILSHGLISSKESSKYVALAEAFRVGGVASCRFDYAGCGESDGSIEETTLTGRIENLNAVAEWIFGHPSVDAGKVGLLGSSFGGCTSLVKAARDARIQCVSLWATPHLLENKDEGSMPDVDFKDMLYEDFARYDLLAEAKKVSRALVVHGEIDDVVPSHEGKAIYRNLKKPKKFELIKGADHVFSVQGHRERAITLSRDWFRRFFV
ncbi:MAG: alpha/beta fold hydrolase [Syntrophorhabdales bacterium]|jgi:dienelactone hydrolase